ncbi:hypothetical protein KJA13_00520 [Patescibacteria group bacterium]|nr:hypothetical protein [Patescibacteria group bacterium]
MKAIYIVLIILVALVAYSFFDQFLSSGNLPIYFQLQKNSSQENSSKTNNALTATVSEPIKQRSNPNPAPEPRKEETTEKTTNISPYSGKVKISGIQAKSHSHRSLITLSYWLREGDEINITKWRIKSRKKEFIIPQAIEKYKSYITPRDIIIKQYGRVYLIGSSNRLGRNKNFCLNKCFGYLDPYHRFYPSIHTYCPKPSLEEISHLNPYCQEFILRLPRCEIPDYSDNLKIDRDSECTSYLKDNFSYSSCFKKYSKDKDFLMNYWYVYTVTNIAHELHDTVYLYDQNGLLVDKYLY